MQWSRCRCQQRQGNLEEGAELAGTIHARGFKQLIRHGLIEKIHIRYRPNVDTKLGIIIDHGVFVRPILANSRNCGTASAIPGTEMAPMMITKHSLRPGKRNLASAIAAHDGQQGGTAGADHHYRIVLTNQRPKIPS